jgi:hypothetical protein
MFQIVTSVSKLTLVRNKGYRSTLVVSEMKLGLPSKHLLF